MFLTVIWSKLLERVNAVSTTLESPSLNLTSGVQLLETLVIFINEFRDKFDYLECTAKSMAAEIETEALYHDETKRIRKRKVFAGETRNNETEYRGRDDSKMNVFYVVCDSLVQDLRRRLESYSEVEPTFKRFFTNDQNIIDDSLEKLCVKNF